MHRRWSAGSARWTFAELDERSNRLAAGAADAGVGAGDRIAHLDQNAPECRRAAVRGGQARRRARPAQLAAGEVRARGDRRGRGREDARRAARTSRTRRRGWPSASSWRATSTRTGSPTDAEDPGFEPADARRRRLPALHVRAPPARPKGVLTTNGNLDGLTTGLRGVGGRRRLQHAPGGDAAVPHRRDRAGCSSRLAQGAESILIREIDPDGAAGDDGVRGRHERVPRPDGAADAVRRGRAPPTATGRKLRSIAYGASPITTKVLKTALKTFEAARCSRSTA